MHLANDETVIADATHLTKSSRAKLLNSLTVTPDMIYVVIMGTPFDVCLDRNSRREGITRVPENRMYQMKNNYQRPNPVVENFDKVVYVK